MNKLQIVLNEKKMKKRDFKFIHSFIQSLVKLANVGVLDIHTYKFFSVWTDDDDDDDDDYANTIFSQRITTFP